MPKLPDKTIFGDIPSGDAGRRMVQLETPRVADYEVAGAVARGMEGFAGALKTRFEKADDYEVQKALVDFDLQQEKRLDDAKREADPEARDFTAKYRGGYDQGATEFMKGVPRHLREKVDTALVKRGAMFEKRAYDFELAQRDKFHIDDVNTRAQDFLNETTAKPEAFLENSERGRALIRASRLPAATKLKLEKQFVEQNEELAVEALRERAKANGEDLTLLRERVRKVPRGMTIGQKSSPDGWNINRSESVPQFTATPRSAWGSDPEWQKLTDVEKAAVMSLLEADQKGGKVDLDSAKNALGAMINRAAKDKENLGAHVSKPIYQPTIEPAQYKRIGRMIASPEFEEMVKLAQSRIAGETPDWVDGATHFLADERVMLALEAREPNKYRSWRKWTGFDGQQYKGVIHRDGSHAFLAPEGKFSAEFGGPSVPDGGGPDAEVAADGRRLAANDDLAEDDGAEFRNLSSAKRRKLLYKIDTDQRGIAKQVVDGEIAKIRRGEMPVTNAFDRALPQLTHQQRIEAQARMKRARVYADTTRKLNDLSDSDMDDAVARLAVGPDTPPEEAAWMDKAHTEALSHAKRIKELRKADPVAALEGNVERRVRPADEIGQARQKIRSMLGVGVNVGMDADGKPTAQQTAIPPDRKMVQQSWKLLLDARVAAQRRVNPDGEVRYITKKEAEDLLALPTGATKVTDKGFRPALQAAADKVSKKYPPEYAEKVMRDAIAWKIKSDEEKRVASGIAAKIAMGQPVREGDLRSWRTLDMLDREALFPQVQMDAERPAIMSAPPVVETPAETDPGVGRAINPGNMIRSPRPEVKAGAPTPTLTPDAKPRAGTTRQTTVPAISGQPEPTPGAKPSAATQASPKLPGKVDPNNPFAKRLREREEVR